MVARILLFAFSQSSSLVAFLANVIAILFAFITNDRIVFRQESRGGEKDLLSFICQTFTMGLDMLLAFLLVQAFPGIIDSICKQ